MRLFYSLRVRVKCHEIKQRIRLVGMEGGPAKGCFLLGMSVKRLMHLKASKLNKEIVDGLGAKVKVFLSVLFCQTFPDYQNYTIKVSLRAPTTSYLPSS